VDRRPASVLPAECRFADNRSSSVVPEWELLNLASVHHCRQERVARCIRRDNHRLVVQWVWALQAWRHHHLRELVRRAVLALQASVLGSVTFRAG
jgi:hypothetical protein